MSDFSQIFFIFTIISLSLCNSFANCEWTPTPEFITTLKTSINITGQVLSQVSIDTSKYLGNSQTGNAIKVCLHLLELSTSDLNFSLSVLQNSYDDAKYGSGDLYSDIRTWLTALLINEDTCLEGFEDIQNNNIVKNILRSGFGKMTSMVQALLKSMPQNPSRDGKRLHFPSSQNAAVSRSTTNVVVAADGTGNFTKIMDAINTAPNSSSSWFVIYIKSGTYDEIVRINKNKTNLVMIGDGMDSTIITGSRSNADGTTTFDTATFAVKGNRFVAQNITFENKAGPANGQAVAFRSNADLSVLHRCGFKGYQDTLYVHNGRQFFKECHITGTVDFIFGNGAAVFQNCTIHVRKGKPDQNFNTITAHGGKDPHLVNIVQGGFSFQFCRILPDESLMNHINTTSTYLGRPWRPFARTVYMETEMSDIVSPKGWLEWNGNENSDSLYYGEYRNNGTGADTSNRVRWRNYHPNISVADAQGFTVANLIDGKNWLPETGVPFIEVGLEVHFRDTICRGMNDIDHNEYLEITMFGISRQFPNFSGIHFNIPSVLIISYFYGILFS